MSGAYYTYSNDDAGSAHASSLDAAGRGPAGTTLVVQMNEDEGGNDGGGVLHLNTHRRRRREGEWTRTAVRNKELFVYRPGRSYGEM